MAKIDKQAKLAKLQLQLSHLKDKLFDANYEENLKLSSRGWGYGMRHSKICFSTRKSDRLKERIEKCKQKINELTQSNDNCHTNSTQNKVNNLKDEKDKGCNICSCLHSGAGV